VPRIFPVSRHRKAFCKLCADLGSHRASIV
jgi:hypothetical protein